MGLGDLWEKCNNGEQAVLILAIGYGIFIASGEQFINGTPLLRAFFVWFIVSAIWLFIIYWIITKIYSKSSDWSLLGWSIALVPTSILSLIILLSIFLFVFGTSA
jgi:hypothetical protein